MKTYYISVSQCVYVEAESEQEAQDKAEQKAIEDNEWLCECLEVTHEDGSIEHFV